jgi:hypothetical protein
VHVVYTDGCLLLDQSTRGLDDPSLREESMTDFALRAVDTHRKVIPTYLR